MKIVIKNNNSIVKEITIQDFEEVTKSDKPYVIKFTNPTCHLCKELKPIFDQLASEYEKYYKFGNINSRKEKQIFRMFGIDAVPEVFIIDGDNITNITYPDNPDPKSGYSKQYLTKHLDEYKTNKN
jgi:thioredoxin 1